MKIIHFADLHLGSKFNNFNEEIKELLNNKLRNAFKYIISYAKGNGINTILMSGDVFDKNAVALKDKKYFYDLIKENSDIDFYYLKGNHDSLSKYNVELENLYTFDTLKYYVKEDVRIIGYELKDDNNQLYNAAKFSSDKFNIMLLHADIYNSNDKNYINLEKLKDKNISYFALGHIHKREYKKEDNIIYSYPGCVIGRGFDEVLEKGFLVLDTKTKNIEFIKYSNILFEQIEINVSKKNEVKIKEEIEEKLKETNKNLITEIKLKGISEVEIDITDLLNSYSCYRLSLTIKNNSRKAVEMMPYKNANSLKNMFINHVLEDSSLDDESKEEVISYTMSKLMKEEV